MLPALDFRWVSPSARWLIVVGSVCNVACALLGCFLLLRRSFSGRGHQPRQVLPGIAVGFSSWADITRPGDRRSIGAMIFGVLTALLTQALHGYASQTPEDSSMGIAFTSLFRGRWSP